MKRKYHINFSEDNQFLSDIHSRDIFSQYFWPLLKAVCRICNISTQFFENDCNAVCESPEQRSAEIILQVPGDFLSL